MNTFTRGAVVLASLLSASMLSGCILGNASTIQEATLGQQLIDLKQARTDDALSETDYERARARLLNRSWASADDS